VSTGPANYRLCGITLQSPLVLPCPHTGRRGRPDVRLRAGRAAEFARARKEAGASGRARDWFRSRRLADGSTYLAWTGLFEFLISPDGRRILYRRLRYATQESFSVYLLGQVLSFSLLAFGVEPLHGTVVVVGGGAVAFLGDCGYGKSTLGAALLARGFPVLTDDLIVLEKREAGWAVHPGIPRIKLSPSIARRLFGPNPKGTPMNPGASKLVLPLSAGQTVQRLVPLTALYVLSEPARRARGGAACLAIERLSGSGAFLEVIRAAFNLLVLERKRLADQFGFASRLAAGVPVRRLTYPRDLSSLDAVCDGVLADLAG
jgi:hypothetical protein